MKAQTVMHGPFFLLFDVAGLMFDVKNKKLKPSLQTSNFNLKALAKRPLLRYNNVANLIKVLVRGNPLGLVQWEPMNLVRSERKQQ